MAENVADDSAKEALHNANERLTSMILTGGNRK